MTLRAFSFATLLAMLTGCSVSMPFKWIGGLSQQNGSADNTPHDEVIVAVTHATVDPARRRIFDEGAYRVLDSLPSQAGLVGYSVRRQLLGNEVWTATIWIDEASMERFVRSPAHLQAVAAGRDAVRNIEYRRLRIQRSDLPMTWGRLLNIADQSQTVP